MLQINAEIYFKSINEKHALTFLISKVWYKIINVYIYNLFFVYLMSDFHPCVLCYEQEKHLRCYCIAHKSDTMCDKTAFPPPLILFSSYQ